MKRIFFLGALLVISLAGCVSSPPKPSDQELAAKRRSTLNIYEDNRVAVKVARPSSYPSLHLWAWNPDKDEALVYSTGDQYYNAKDLTRITKDRNSGRMTAYLKNGTTKAFPERDFKVFWCKRNKECSWTNSGSMKATYELHLNKTPERDPRFDVASGDDAKPYMMENEIVILDDAGYAELGARVEKMHKRWADTEPQRARAEAEKTRKTQEERSRWHSARIGTKEFCSGTSLDAHPSRTKFAPYNCLAFGRTTPDQLTAAGWTIINVIPRQINQFGQIATVYDISVEKVR